MTLPLECLRLTLRFDRLEAATSRLEDIATSIDGPGATTTNGLAGAALATPSASAATPEPAAPAPEPLPRSVEAFDKIIEEDVEAFVKAAEKVGGLVAEQVRMSPLYNHAGRADLE